MEEGERDTRVNNYTGKTETRRDGETRSTYRRREEERAGSDGKSSEEYSLKVMVGEGRRENRKRGEKIREN